MLSHLHNGSNHRNKTNAYGALVIRYEIAPKTLSNMEQEFHLQICKGWYLLCIWTSWFSKTQNWVGNVQSTISHQHK